MKYLKMILKNNTWHNTKRYCAQELSKKFENFRVPSRAKNLTWCWTVMSPYLLLVRGSAFISRWLPEVERGEERQGRGRGGGTRPARNEMHRMRRALRERQLVDCVKAFCIFLGGLL
jgi:hypothetical protein